MATKADIIEKIAHFKADFVEMDPETEGLSAEDIYERYFYEESEELLATGFNPQTGEHVRVGDKIYYKPNVSHKVPESLRTDLHESKLEDDSLS